MRFKILSILIERSEVEHLEFWKGLYMCNWRQFAVPRAVTLCEDVGKHFQLLWVEWEVSETEIPLW